MYFVYILKSVHQEYFYKGLTNNLDRRLEEHFGGRVLATRNKRPLHLVHVELCQDRVEAREMEKFLKSGFGREIIKEIVNMRMW